MRTEAWERALRNCSKEVGGEGQYICDFGEGGVHAVKHICFQKVSTGLVRLLLVTRSSHHHKGFKKNKKQTPNRDSYLVWFLKNETSRTKILP